MKSEVTVIITNWKRQTNVRKLIYTLSTQTTQVKTVIIDNSFINPDSLAWGYNTIPLDIDKYILNKENQKCYPRWQEAMHADTKYVMILDDDIEILTNTFIEEIKKQYEEENVLSALGVAGIKLYKKFPYKRCSHFGLGHRRAASHKVDILKGRCFFTETINLKYNSVDIEAAKDDMLFCDDIVISSIVRKYGELKLFTKYPEHVKTLPEGKESLSKQKGHYKERERIRRKYFKI